MYPVDGNALDSTHKSTGVVPHEPHYALKARLLFRISMMFPNGAKRTFFAFLKSVERVFEIAPDADLYVVLGQCFTSRRNNCPNFLRRHIFIFAENALKVAQLAPKSPSILMELEIIISAQASLRMR